MRNAQVTHGNHIRVNPSGSDYVSPQNLFDWGLINTSQLAQLLVIEDALRAWYTFVHEPLVRADDFHQQAMGELAYSRDAPSYQTILQKGFAELTEAERIIICFRGFCAYGV